MNTNYDFVDLGLPSGLLWAEENVNSNSFYQFGSGEKTYKETCFNDLHSNKGKCSKNALKCKYDTARQTMGGKWRIPTLEDVRELLDYTKMSFEGASIKFTGRNGNYILIPYCVTFCGDKPMEGISQGGGIWTSTPKGDNEAYCLFRFGVYIMTCPTNITDGLQVRGVMPNK